MCGIFSFQLTLCWSGNAANMPFFSRNLTQQASNYSIIDEPQGMLKNVMLFKQISIPKNIQKQALCTITTELTTTRALHLFRQSKSNFPFRISRLLSSFHQVD